MKKLIIGLMGVMSFVAMGASFSYQGVLRDAQGGKLTDSAKIQTIEFRLYNGPAETVALWGRSVVVNLDDDGLFNVELGDAAGSEIKGVDKDGKEVALTAALDDVLAAYGNATLYIGLTVAGSSGEIRPRQKVLAVPVASFAQDVKMAKNDFTVSGRAVVNGALTVNGNVEMKGTNRVNVLSVEKGSAFAGPMKVTGTLNFMGGHLVMDKESTFEIGGVSAVIPKGVIVMWSGSANNVPSGWALCDGGNGRPDLRNRFIVGAGDSYGVGATGGAASVTLTKEQMPSHSHNLTMYGGDLVGAWKDSNNFFMTWTKYDRNSNTKVTDATGGGQAHENRPPYYALCFIIKL